MKNKFNPSDYLILALDGINKEDVSTFVSLIPDLRWVKVGLELFMCAGPEILISLRELGINIFLDLKFHDIPATMGAVCRKAAQNNVQLMTVHACAGFQALRKAQSETLLGAQESGFSPPTLLAVTVLTSWQAKQFQKELLISQSLQNRVELLAGVAYEAGLGGVVCSPHESNALRKIYQEPFEIITPGIRLDDSDKNDQARFLGPCEALKEGASKIVVGRPITRSSDPNYSFKRYCDDIAKFQ
tara:strand:+ start:305 stop:1036 length:732 start_codon:yes stop_codon:yes gene_type:complete